MSDDQSEVVTLKVRVSPEFRERIVTTAKENGRSMNAEIVHRLEQSFCDINDHDNFDPINLKLDIEEIKKIVNEINKKAP